MRLHEAVSGWMVRIMGQRYDGQEVRSNRGRVGCAVSSVRRSDMRMLAGGGCIVCIVCIVWGPYRERIYVGLVGICNWE